LIISYTYYPRSKCIENALYHVKLSPGRHKYSYLYIRYGDITKILKNIRFLKMHLRRFSNVYCQPKESELIRRQSISGQNVSLIIIRKRNCPNFQFFQEFSIFFFRKFACIFYGNFLYLISDNFEKKSSNLEHLYNRQETVTVVHIIFKIYRVHPKGFGLTVLKEANGGCS